MVPSVFLSLGSNLGDRETNLVRAIHLIGSMEGFELISTSPIYISEAVEMSKSAPTFLNMVIEGKFQYTPLELLNNLQEIERKMGRESKGDYKPRTIDIDILLFGDKQIKIERLNVPHPKMTKRDFVLTPLLQIVPDLVHPVSGKRFDSFLKNVESDKLMIYKENIRVNV